MKANKLVAATLLMAMLTGCATSRNSFYSDPMAVGDGQICRTLAGEEVKADPQFENALRTELRLRGVNEADCASIVGKENVAIGVGAVIGAAIIAAAVSSDDDDNDHHHHRRSRRHSETYVDIDIAVPAAAAVAVVAASPADSQWDWDQYRNSAGSLVWGCRGVQTRLLADPAKCTGLDMTDARWPEKTF